MKALSLSASLLITFSFSSLASGYTVKSGDTLHSISRKHKVSVTKIMSLNKITDPTKLRIGQTLKVSEGRSNQSSSRSTSSTTTSSYKVSRGDTFYSIARRHKISVAKLQSLNPGVNANRLSLGQTLSVSGTARAAVKELEKKPTPVAQSTPKKRKTLQKADERQNTIKISTATTLAMKTTSPAPKKESVAVVEDTHSSVSTPPAPPVVDPPSTEAEVLPTKSSSVVSVILTDQTTFHDFASKHGTDTSQLNALNGWNLPKATVLARGSEIYVPQ